MTDRRALRRIVAETRTNGFAVTWGEATEGVAGIAAPIFGARGEVVAAFVLAGPIARVEPRLALLSQRVRDAAGEVSRRLGHRIT